MIKNIIAKMLWLSTTFMLISCDDVFDVHPYDVNIKGETHINNSNISKIEKLCKDKDTLKIAFISDTHGWYSDFKDEIADINKRNDIDFVIHCGDITDTGTTKEYEWARSIFDKLNVLHVALIGNHDFLGTGDQAYHVMFGDNDFSFIAGRVKFVCLNTNATEYDYLASVPNFDFMENEQKSRSSDFDRTIIVMHARPGSEQFNNNVSKAFNYFVHLFPGIMFCVSGHEHATQADELFNDKLMWYGVDCAQHRKYDLFTITKEGYKYEVVNF